MIPVISLLITSHYHLFIYLLPSYYFVVITNSLPSYITKIAGIPSTIIVHGEHQFENLIGFVCVCHLKKYVEGVSWIEIWLVGIPKEGVPENVHGNGTGVLYLDVSCYGKRVKRDGVKSKKKCTINYLLLR